MTLQFMYDSAVTDKLCEHIWCSVKRFKQLKRSWKFENFIQVYASAAEPGSK